MGAAYVDSYKDLALTEHISLSDLCATEVAHPSIPRGIPGLTVVAATPLCALLFNPESGPAALFYCTRYPLKTAESHYT